MTVYIILTNCLLIITIFVIMLLNAWKQIFTKHKKYVTKEKKRNLHIQCVTYEQ